MTRIGIGLIGLGRHGMRYARHLLQDVPGAKLVAVCRRTGSEGVRFAAEHRVQFYREYRRLIAAADVDAVVVVTPPAVARPICLEAVRAKKPLLIEKPLAPTGAEAWEMVHAAEAARVPLMTAQTQRFDATLRAFASELQTVGERQYLVLTSRTEAGALFGHDPSDYAGRGVLLEPGIHLLDLVRFLTGEEVAEVRCEMERPSPGHPETRCLASLRTVGGFPCVLDISRVTSGRVGRAEWIGARGQLLADWISRRLCRLSTAGPIEERDIEQRATVIDTLEAFTGALRQGCAMPITGLDGLRAVEIADACYESAATGRTIRLKHNTEK